VLPPSESHEHLTHVHTTYATRCHVSSTHLYRISLIAKLTYFGMHYFLERTAVASKVSIDGGGGHNFDLGRVSY
jgi:hypothetical protein